jgi:hypothetical protein
MRKLNLLRFIESTDFRYENTLRINFNFYLGLGSYCDTVEELKEEYEYIYEDLSKEYTDKEIQMFIDFTDKVNSELLSILGDVELDWRDYSEIEIHGVSKDIHIKDFV